MMVIYFFIAKFFFRYRRALRKRKQGTSKEQESTGNDEEMAKKADLARVKERATLKHKTISKKLRFYDQTNTKESEVRRTQNVESQKLRTKVDLKEDSDDEEEGQNETKIVDSDDEEVLVKTSASAVPKKTTVTTKRINPNDFVQTEIKDVNQTEYFSDEEGDEDEQDAFTADIATFDSGIE